MEKELLEHIKLKTAISLNTLLSRAKNSTFPKGLEIARSHGQIATHAVIRKATVTNIFNAKTIPGTATLILIIQAMGFNIIDFGEIYESLKSKDYNDLKINLIDIKEKQR